MERTHCNCGLHMAALMMGCLAIGPAGCQKGSEPTDGANAGANTTTTSAPATAPAPASGLLSGVGPASAPATASAPAAEPVAPAAPTIFTWDDKKDGVQLQYTSAWVSKPDNDYVLRLDPADPSSERRIFFDVPELPWHPSFISIPIGSVENGYVDDLKGVPNHKGFHKDSSADHPMGNGVKAAHLVESGWTQDGAPWKNVALLIVRGDHVYILSSRSDLAHWAATRADFDRIMASLSWTK